MYSSIPDSWRRESAVSFCKDLLRKNPAERLGSKAYLEIFNHPYLADVDWAKLHENENPIEIEEFEVSMIQGLNGCVLCSRGRFSKSETPSSA